MVVSENVIQGWWRGVVLGNKRDKSEKGSSEYITDMSLRSLGANLLHAAALAACMCGAHGREMIVTYYKYYKSVAYTPGAEKTSCWTSKYINSFKEILLPQKPCYRQNQTRF